MAITSSQDNTPLVPQFASGSTLDSAATPAAVTITLGFSPRYILVLNETTRVQSEWFKGMAATNTLKTAANGTRTLDTASMIVVTDSTPVQANPDDDDAVSGAAYQSTYNQDKATTFVIAANTMAQNDQIRWRAVA